MASNDPEVLRRTAVMEFFGEEAFAGVATPKRNMLSESDGAAAAGGGHGLPDVPSESMTRAEREDWVRKAKKAMTAEQRLLLAMFHGRSGRMPPLCGGPRNARQPSNARSHEQMAPLPPHQIH